MKNLIFRAIFAILCVGTMEGCDDFLDTRRQVFAVENRVALLIDGVTL